MSSKIDFFFRALLTFTSLWVMVQDLNAQQYTAHVKKFGIEHGLSHHDARAVAIDSRGLVWVGTRFGLNRFDGEKFKTFYVEDGLLSNNIESLFADGHILVCIHKSRTTEAIEGISLFNAITEKTIDFQDWSGITEIDISDINALYGNRKEIVFRAEKNGGVFWFLKRLNQKAKKLELEVPFELMGSSQNGTFWFHEWQNNSITHRSESGELLQTVSTKFLKTWPGQFYVDMRFGEHEKWLFAYDSLYQIIDGRLTHQKSLWGVQKHKNRLVQLPSEFVRKHPSTGLLWFSLNSSSYLIDSAGHSYFSHTDQGQYVNNTDVFVNNVVLQPTSDGLNIISLYPSKFKTFNDGIKGSYRGISKLGNDYLTCNLEGVRVLKGDFSEIKKHISYVGDNAFSAKDVVYTVGRQTINTIDSNQNLVATQHLPFAHEIWGLAVVDSLLMYSTYGLHQFNLHTKTDRFIASTEFPELNSSTIYSIQQKMADTYWLCTTKGLFTWNIKTDAIEKVVNEVDGCSEFQHLYQEGDTLWLASGCVGLVAYSLSTQQYEAFDFAHKATNITHAVYPDGRKNLWLSTDYGIVRFNKEHHNFEVFLEREGLINNEFNRISHFKDDDGTIVFGGVKGLVKFHPDSLAGVQKQLPRLEPFVVDVWLYKKGGNVISEVTNSFNQEHTITIEPQDRFLSFDLATNSIEHYDRVNFSYKFETIEDWNELPGNRLEFNILPFGTHNVRIRASLPNGATSKTDLQFEIKVLKPIYLQTWFIALILISLLGASIIAVLIRTKVLEKQKLVLENEVTKRTQKIKEAKETIEQQAEELQSLDTMKNRFFANISHELRNPLTLIVGPVENLLSQNKVKVPAVVRSQMNLTLKNARSLQKRVNEILALSKIDSGKIRLNVSSVAPASFFKRITLSFESLAAVKEIQMEYSSTLDETKVVKLDIDQTEKVVNNLLSNAIKHAPEQTNVLIELSQVAENQYCLSVSDAGKGVEQSEREKIFDRYYQSAEGEKAGGTGLGLALSSELAQLMGGNIRVDNTHTPGARFLFTFHAETSTEAPYKQEAEAASQRQPEEGFQALNLETAHFEANVLVVDDMDEMRQYVKSILGTSCRVYEAKNGLDALKMLETRKIDLITSDLMMPEMDGMELLEALKANDKTKSIPVILLTARADDTDKLSALELGVDDYITKPFYARELLARVKNLLEKRQNRAQASAEESELSTESTEAELHIKKVVEVIQARLANNAFGVIDLAEEIGYSERQLRRIIKKEKGVTPNALIKELRLNQARLYLEQQQFATVSEVMLACGLKSAGHFTTNYFERYGKNPSEYFV